MVFMFINIIVFSCSIELKMKEKWYEKIQKIYIQSFLFVIGIFVSVMRENDLCISLGVLFMQGGFFFNYEFIVLSCLEIIFLDIFQVWGLGVGVAF